MTAKKFNSFSSLVFSTNPDAIPNEEPEEVVTPEARQQQLRVRIEKKHRGGKTVTIVDGFRGKEDDMEELGRKLKNRCGAGGSAKDGIILVQGEFKEKIIAVLKEWGYSQTKG
jgi:translation initiation factor 1